ncbi:Uncharacterized protein Fot_10370 [Forsythia ovata]|uniref:Uncharacterized protein n=1 Tax=Forsythia ovata TaxID=205694 RepID=A0ABD1WKC0_9LAMI
MGGWGTCGARGVEREREEIVGFDGDAELWKEIVLGYGFVEKLEHIQMLRIAIDKHCNFGEGGIALAKAVHGSAPDIVGKLPENMGKPENAKPDIFFFVFKLLLP